MGTKCHSSPDIMGLLMKTEGDYIVKRYPQLGPVPHIEIDHVAADPEKRDYATLLKGDQGCGVPEDYGRCLRMPWVSPRHHIITHSIPFPPPAHPHSGALCLAFTWPGQRTREMQLP